MIKHTVHSFDDDLKKLSSMITKMGGQVESQLATALTMIESPSKSVATKIINDDAKIDQQEKKINDFAIEMIALRQPLAADLREITSAIKIAANLERIGDLAKHIASLISNSMPNKFPYNISSGIHNMGKLSLRQLGGALDAFARADKQIALHVWQGDKELDDLYNSLLRETMTYILEDTKLITQCVNMLFTAKYIERAGDHATSIAEHILYAITGNTPSDRPKGAKPVRKTKKKS